MSKHEQWRTRQYWKSIGGLLIEEFIAVKKSKDHSIRQIDGVIVLGLPTNIHDKNIFDIKGKDIICIQTKKNRLGMSVMGQAFFTRELLRQHQPKTIKSVIICSKDDAVLNKICKRHKLEVVLINEP